MSQSSNPYRDWELARRALRMVLRDWATDLSALEFRAALFVYDRTIGWGKKWETITQRHLSQGVYSPEGDCWASPVSSNATRARTALLSLVEKGYVLRQQASPKVLKYALNLEMKVPKRVRKCDQNEGRYRNENGDGIVTKMGTEPYHKEIYYKGRRTKEELRACETLADFPDQKTQKAEAEFVVERVMVASRKRRDLKKRSGTFERRSNGEESGFVPYRTGLELVWKDFHKKYFPEAGGSAIDSLSLKIFHCYAKNWTHLRNSGEFLDFLEWVFQNWTTLKAGPFSWIQDFPLCPSVKIIVSNKLKNYIEEAYRKKEWWDRWRAMDEFERRVEQLVTMKGVDREKATQIAKRETGFSDQLEVLKEERRKLELTALRVKQAYSQGREAMRRQAERLNGNNVNRVQNTEGDFGAWE